MGLEASHSENFLIGLSLFSSPTTSRTVHPMNVALAFTHSLTIALFIALIFGRKRLSARRDASITPPQVT